jgi:poly-gamma-glutamate synthase PgsB/CapB
LFVLIACLAAFLLFLTGERIALDRARRHIPIRIAVTGTRGKSGVARMLASVLRESGRKVIAKTTGSESVIVFPDGTEQKACRRGPASIREQIGLVRTASRAGADCLVAEVMSLQPENHFSESRQILQPTLVAITNARLDHTETMGATVEEIASVLALDITPGSSVFIPGMSLLAPITEAANSRGAGLFPIPAGEGARFYGVPGQGLEFPENIDLVCAIARSMDINDETIQRGLEQTRHDIGRLGVWQVGMGTRAVYFVNAFAANDPESTFGVLAKVRERVPGNLEATGLLNLRQDRGARTMQWIGALKERGNAFHRLFVTGGHSAVLHRRYPAARILKRGTPEKMTAEIVSGLTGGAIVFGFGNIKGSGLELSKHWSRLGTPYGI